MIFLAGLLSLRTAPIVIIFTSMILAFGANATFVHRDGFDLWRNATFVHEASVWTKSPISDFYEIGSCDSNTRLVANSPQNLMTGPGWVQLVNEEKSFFQTRVSTHYNDDVSFYM